MSVQSAQHGLPGAFALEIIVAQNSLSPCPGRKPPARPHYYFFGRFSLYRRRRLSRRHRRRQNANDIRMAFLNLFACILHILYLKSRRLVAELSTIPPNVLNLSGSPDLLHSFSEYS